MRPLRSLADWLDSRTGFRAGRSHLLDESLPAGIGWWFVTGSILLLLLGIQLITGVVLAMYYVPSPEHAYDSVRYITDALPFGALVRGLHFFGASFIVVAAVVHMLRVVLFGSYKKPREVTWITGVVLLLVILGFALSGYLLPWDQKAYWATTVTINIARSTPLVGDQVAALLRGGLDLGALTLGRWYAAHVFLLPACLIGFVVAHLYLMRRHGIAGPITAQAGEAKPFYPYHAIKDTIAMAVVFAVLLTLASTVPAPLDAIADPSDATYVPRPEWYFLSLFELLKYFPGPLEPVATIVIPGLVIGGLFALPFLDRRMERRPLHRPVAMVGLLLTIVAMGVLTYKGATAEEAGAAGAEAVDAWIADNNLPEDVREGAELFATSGCLNCHTYSGSGASNLGAPDLTDIGAQQGKDVAYLHRYIADPSEFGNTVMPKFESLGEENLTAISEFLAASKGGG